MYIGIPVVPLDGVHAVDVRVGTDKPPNQRVIHPAIHVDQAEIIQVLMAGVAVVGGDAFQGVGSVVGAVAIAALAPGVVAHAFEQGAGLVGDDAD